MALLWAPSVIGVRLSEVKGYAHLGPTPISRLTYIYRDPGIHCANGSKCFLKGLS